MKTAIVISDSHGNRAMIEKIKPLIAENDYVIHLGDGANDMLEVYKEFPDKTYVCNGNCDYYGSRISLDEWEIEIEGHTLFCCHGHKYGVKTSLETIKREAIKRRCSAALYGHTHIADITEEDGVQIINPGTLSLYSSGASYCYLVITKDKIVSALVKIQ